MESYSFILVNFLVKGGFFMWPLLAVSFLVIAISLERYLAYRLRYGIDGAKLFNQVKKYLAANDRQRAIETCRQHSLVPLAQVLASGLDPSHQNSIEEMDVAMEAEALKHVPRLTDRLGYISVLANIATLLGLLGTVSGLIASFAAVGTETGAAKGMALASGIAVAMNTTAFGLIIAIPSLLIHHYLFAQANRIIDDIQHYSSELKRTFQRMRSGKGIDFERTDSKKPSEEVSIRNSSPVTAST